MEKFLEIVRKKYPAFEVDQYNTPVIEKFLTWLNNDSVKGFVLSGDYGCGKTILMKSLQHFMLMTSHSKMFNMRTAWSVAIDYANEGFTTFDKILKINYCFDELGLTERETVNHYGNKINVSDALILERYNLFMSEGISTHFTTNLHPDDFKKVYDGRTVSRLSEMCEIVIMRGADRRPKSTNNFITKPELKKPEQPPLTGELAKKKIEELKAIVEKPLDQKIQEQQRIIRENPANIFAQEVFRDFDRIYRDQLISKETEASGKRFIKVDGVMLDDTGYLEFRLKTMKP